MEIILAQPRGFCAGVERAVQIVEAALKKYGTPIYVRHEIVHNKYVVDNLRNKGVIFVDNIEDIPNGAITIFSAHGVSEEVENKAKQRKLPIIDATCPLVTKVHKEAIANESEGRQIILIGHNGHPEVEGTSGRVKSNVLLVESLNDVASLVVNDPNKLAYVTQTTLSVDDTKTIIEALKQKFPAIKGPDLKNICYATQNRQNAVKDLAKIVDLILVIGAKNSSNSNRLCDLGNETGTPSYLIDDASSINLSWFNNVNKVGITAGASAPENLIDNVVAYIKDNFLASVSTMKGIEEKVNFKLPKEITGES